MVSRINYGSLLKKQAQIYFIENTGPIYIYMLTLEGPANLNSLLQACNHTTKRNVSSAASQHIILQLEKLNNKTIEDTENVLNNNFTLIPEHRSQQSGETLFATNNW